jgi:hypothetical protein
VSEQSETEKPYYVNNRDQWKHDWTRGIATNTNATYPLDGRETIYPPYERYGSTETVGGYLDAYKRATEGESGLPSDYVDYILQRVSNLPINVDPMNKIDRWGRVEGGYSQPVASPEIETMLQRVLEGAEYE